MPLTCDCYGGCWGDHSKDWCAIAFSTTERAQKAHVACWKYLDIPHGSYVLVGNELRLENKEYKLRVMTHFSLFNTENKITPDEYQRQALRTEYTPAFANGTEHLSGTELGRLLHAALGMCTETGELQDMVKKHLIYTKDFDRVNVLEECGDVLWYIALALDATGFTFEECMKRNIDKLRKRFPDKFTSEKALVRDLDAERAALEAKP